MDSSIEKQYGELLAQPQVSVTAELLPSVYAKDYSQSSRLLSSLGWEVGIFCNFAVIRESYGLKRI